MHMLVTSCRAKGPAIWNARRRPGRRPMTLEDVARKADTTKSYISRIERGVQNCSPKMARQIAKALGCEVDELFEVVPKDPPKWVQEYEATGRVP